MQLPVDAVRTADITEKMREHIVELDGISYIQVHPAFLYEMVWNLIILILVLLYYKKKVFEGELFLIYVALYGIGRTWIEALRVDKLRLPFGNLPVSLIFAVVSAAVSIVLIIHFKKRQSESGEWKSGDRSAGNTQQKIVNRIIGRIDIEYAGRPPHRKQQRSCGW